MKYSRKSEQEPTEDAVKIDQSLNKIKEDGFIK